MYRKILYTIYLLFFRNTPEDWRPYALFFPYLRNVLVRNYLSVCGKGLRVKSGAEISPRAKVGHNTELGTRCIVQSDVTLGSYIIMGPDVKIYCRNHRYEDIHTPMGLQGKITKPTKLGDDIWIGSNVVIVAGINVGDHTIIAAGSIVTKNIPDYAIVGGNPARIIKYRNV